MPDLCLDGLLETLGLLVAQVRAYERAFGETRPVGPMDAWFDAAHIAVYGEMPVVGMGAGVLDVAHSQVEWIRIDDMVANTKAVALTAYDYLSA